MDGRHQVICCRATSRRALLRCQKNKDGKVLEQVCHTVHETGLYVQVLPEYIPALYQRFHAKKWEKFNSEKVCNISYARIQGKSSLIHHFSNSSLLHEDKRCRPIIFRSDGRLAGEQEPFPVASHVSPPLLRLSTP